MLFTCGIDVTADYCLMFHTVYLLLGDDALDAY